MEKAGRVFLPMVFCNPHLFQWRFKHLLNTRTDGTSTSTSSVLSTSNNRLIEHFYFQGQLHWQQENPTDWLHSLMYSLMLCQDIKSLDSNRGDRIKYFERHIAELQKSAKQNVDKIEKQREKTEQAQVEVEVLRNELLQMEGKEQD